MSGPVLPPSAGLSSTSIAEDAFLSYSRRDTERVRPLLEALIERGRSISFDQEDIHGGEQWRQRLKSLIEHAQNLLFTISPASLVSTECRWELDLAATLNKRVVPVLLVPVDPAELPESLSAIQWIDATHAESLSSVVDQVVAALETDQEWAEFHTRLALRTEEWAAGGSPLSAREIRAAESTMVRFAGKRPYPTSKQSAFLIESRKALKRKRQWAGAIAVVVVAVLASLGFGWFVEQRNADYLALQRQGDQALNQLGGGDLAAGVSSLGYVVGADMQGLLKQYSALLGFWLPRLASIDDIKRDAAAGDLVQWRGQTYVKSDASKLALLPVREPFRAAALEGGRELLLAHNTGVSLLGLPGLPSTVELKYPSARVRPDELYAAPVPGVYVSIGRRTVITNDEDHPEEIHSCLAILLSPPAARSMAPLSDCSSAVKEGLEYEQDEQQMTHTAGADGWVAYAFCSNTPFAVRRIDVPSDAVIASEGAAPSPTRISFDAHACRVKIESITAEDLERPSTHRTLTTTSHAFPRRKDEQGFWKTVPAAKEAASTPSSSAPPGPEIFDLAKDGDFRGLPNAEEVMRRIENNDALEYGTFRKGSTRYPWFAYVSGNSFQTIFACEVAAPNRVERCSDVELGVIYALSPSSSDGRWIAYAPCNSTEEPLTFYDVSRLDHNQALPSGTAPDHTVVGVTFNARSDRAAALTEADELFVFDTAGDQLRPARKVELAGDVSARRAPRPGNGSVPDEVRDLCGERTVTGLRFVNDRTVVGLTVDRQLFAVNVDTGDVLWRRAPSLLQEAGAVRLVTGKRRDLLVVSVGSMYQLFDAATGTPLSDAVDVAKLAPQSDAKQLYIEDVGVAEDGGVEITLLDKTRVIRQPPLTDPAMRDALKTIERATGFSSADGRSVLQRLPD